MAQQPTHIEVEARFRALIDESAIPSPDEVVHLERAVAFFWNGSKSIVVIDLDEVEPETLDDLDVETLFDPPWDDDPLHGSCPEAA